ncbi:hypothetical protein D9M73_213630 [compost metagenome]
MRLGQVKHQVGAAFTVGGVERQVLQGHLRAGRQQLFQTGFKLRLFRFGQLQLRNRLTGLGSFGGGLLIGLQFCLVDLHQRQRRRDVEVLQAHGQLGRTHSLAVQGHFTDLVVGMPGSVGA